jgi:hypothetical protein
MRRNDPFNNFDNFDKHERNFWRAWYVILAAGVLFWGAIIVIAVLVLKNAGLL